MMYTYWIAKRNSFNILKTALKFAKQHEALSLLEKGEALVRDLIALHTYIMNVQIYQIQFGVNRMHFNNVEIIVQTKSKLGAGVK